MHGQPYVNVSHLSACGRGHVMNSFQPLKYSLKTIVGQVYWIEGLHVVGDNLNTSLRPCQATLAAVRYLQSLARPTCSQTYILSRLKVFTGIMIMSSEALIW